ncbi:MAG: DUF3558 domain-containing protein [Pseudonocardia sp.]
MRPLVSVALAGLVMLVGCTGGSVGPASTSQALAPPVAQPKEARGVDPCTLLTAAQLDTLGLDPTRVQRDDSAGLVGCRWPSKVFGFSVSSTLDTEPTRKGLTSLYSRRAGYPLFEPLQIDGYPAVHAELVISEDCTIYVGLSDTQVLDVRTGAPALRGQDSCSITKRAISAMLTNLPPQR